MTHHRCLLGINCEGKKKWRSGKRMLEFIVFDMGLIKRPLLNYKSHFIFFYVLDSSDRAHVTLVCVSMQCILVVSLGGEVGCMISEGPWLFVGLPNLVKVHI